MRINFTYNKDNIQNEDQLLRVTALAYLEDALANERYEECAELIRAAKEYGATIGEVRTIVAEGAQGAAKGRGKKTPARANGRRRI